MARPPKPKGKKAKPRFVQKGEQKKKGPTLRELSRAALTPREFQRVIAQRLNGSERTAAILTAISVENMLLHTILFFLEHRDEKTVEKLTGMGGALSSFSQKIEMGYALGLYDEEVRHDLNIVRTIRNAFAHTEKPINFRTKEVKDEWAKIKSPKIVGHAVWKEFTDGKIMQRNSKRAEFLYLCLGVEKILGDKQKEALENMRLRLERARAAIAKLPHFKEDAARGIGGHFKVGVIAEKG